MFLSAFHMKNVSGNYDDDVDDENDDIDGNDD